MAGSTPILEGRSRLAVNRPNTAEYPFKRSTPFHQRPGDGRLPISHRCPRLAPVCPVAPPCLRPAPATEGGGIAPRIVDCGMPLDGSSAMCVHGWKKSRVLTSGVVKRTTFAARVRGVPGTFGDFHSARVRSTLKEYARHKLALSTPGLHPPPKKCT